MSPSLNVASYFDIANCVGATFGVASVSKALSVRHSFEELVTVEFPVIDMIGRSIAVIMDGNCFKLVIPNTLNDAVFVCDNFALLGYCLFKAPNELYHLHHYVAAS
jgi:hypothetical protein